MQKEDSPECRIPPLPPLRWDGYTWTGQQVVPAFAGYQSRRGSYGSQDSREASDGTVDCSGPHFLDHGRR